MEALARIDMRSLDPAAHETEKRPQARPIVGVAAATPTHPGRAEELNVATKVHTEMAVAGGGNDELNGPAARVNFGDQTPDRQ